MLRNFDKIKFIGYSLRYPIFDYSFFFKVIAFFVLTKAQETRTAIITMDTPIPIKIFFIFCAP